MLIMDYTKNDGAMSRKKLNFFFLPTGFLDKENRFSEFQDTFNRFTYKT